MPLRNRARKCKSEGDYENAIMLYETLYAESSDCWVGFEYAQCLKKANQIDKALEISRQLHAEDSTFEHNNYLLAWLLYDKHFRNLKENNGQIDFDELYDIALFVTTIVSQNDNSPYEIILLRLLKTLKKSGQSFEDKMLTILAHLDASKLSDVPRTYAIDGKVKPYQSDRELYYGTKTKALYGQKQFTACLACCEEALSVIRKFHHNNDLWIEVRKALCTIDSVGIESTIEKLKCLVQNKNHWVLYAEIAKLYRLQKDIDSALLNYCRAAVTSDPPRLKVAIFHEMSKLLRHEGEQDAADLHALYVKRIREAEGWGHRRTLEKQISKIVDQGQTQEDLKHQLSQIWVEKIHKALGSCQGTVIELHKMGQIGLIHSEQGSFAYKSSSIVGQCRVKKGDQVSFVTLSTYDKRKSQVVPEATYIKVCNLK